MSNNTNLDQQNLILVSDLLIKVSALENALLNSKVISKEDVELETKKVVAKLTDIINSNVATTEPI
jgi:hypothetical protein